jgi:3-oxoacyl-[acyl-carrier-protein] synthase II
LDGPSLTVAGACAGGLLALVRGVMMLRTGEADRVLVVAAEASVHPLFLASFERLGVMPRPGVGCRPFDRERDGFLMSEAAAAVCLEKVSSPGKYPQVGGYAIGGDAVNMTAGDPDGAVLRNLLRRVVADRPLDLIHAHGTGTQHNDPIELAAYEATVPETRAPFLYSHKGALGHSLGAAGLMSVVLSCAMHERSIVLPNTRTRNPLASARVQIGGDAIGTGMEHGICVASGFGGPTAVISLVSGRN